MKHGIANLNTTKSPSVAIIILNWNNWQDTIECLESLAQIDYPNYQVIVVDNGSSDNSVSQIKQRFPAIQLLETGKNLGFSGGVNFGFQHALSKDFDFFLLLNNDTIVKKDFLSVLLSTMIREEEFGIAAGKIYYYNDNKRIWSAGGGITKILKRTYHIGEKAIDKGQFDKIREVSFLSGCCMLIKREVIQQIGLLDLDYFMYYEDVDFCIRAKKNKFKIVYDPNSIIWHKVSKSTDKSIRDFFRMRNTIIVLKKQFEMPKSILSLITGLIFFERLFRIIIRKFIFFDNESINKRIRSLIRGAIDGMKFIPKIKQDPKNDNIFDRILL